MNSRARIKRLESVVKLYGRLGKPTAFILEDGSRYTTPIDPVEYLFTVGVETPRGKIVKYCQPEEGLDPISKALYDMIDEGIAAGGLSCDI